jgi:hypothetical protein
VIYLVPEVKSGLGEDTFWLWFAREFENASFDIPATAQPQDCILQYATLGPSKVVGGKKIALLWELYPEMKARGFGGDDAKIERMKACAAASDCSVITSPLMAEFFDGEPTVLPIGVDTDLFCRKPQAELREKHGITATRVGFWCGTDHPMKGRDRMNDYAAQHPGVYWITVSKNDGLPQQKLAELMNCADFALFTGRLRPYFMVEWEAMACDVPVIDISECERDFIPGEHPREDVMRLGWSRHDAKKAWSEFLCAS